MEPFITPVPSALVLAIADTRFNSHRRFIFVQGLSAGHSKLNRTGPDGSIIIG